MQVYGIYNTPNAQNSQVEFGCRKKISPKIISSYADMVSGKLGVDFASVNTLLYNASRRQLHFLNILADRYVSRNFYAAQKENPENVLEVFKQLKSPKKIHFGVVQYDNGSFEYLGKVLGLAKDKKTLEFVKNSNQSIFGGREFSHEVMLDILRSPYKKQYMKHLGDYLSYFKLNRMDENSVKKLDKLIENGQYNKEIFNAKYSAKKLAGDKRIREAIDTETLEKYYSKSGVDFINRFFGQYFARNEHKITNQDAQKIISMYKTTTPKNLEIRTWIMDRFRYIAEKNDDVAVSEINAMNSLFEKIDNSKYAKEFVEDFLAKHVPIDSIKSLNEIFEYVPTRKANIFHKNIYRIITATRSGEERIKALMNEVTNPFFETAISKQQKEIRYNAIKNGFGTRESKFKNLRKDIENKFNLFKYNYLSENGFEAKKLFKDFKIAIFGKSNKTEQIVKGELNQIIPETVPEINKTATPVVDSVQVVPAVEVVSVESPAALNLVNTVKESPQARKLRVINDVNEIIKKKLHAKTLEKQQADYSKNATKMRLKLLPEIFDSVKETRKVDREIGKLKSNSSNKDVLKLYNRINGKNRKLVRYMLLKRNVDGTRMFEVSDIIAFIDRAESNIAKAKAKNPAIKSADIKLYYNHLFDVKIEQYGKVKPRRKK